ncbi:MAG: histidine ammonia-lyase [Bacteroidetes bacterium]|nr:histidine ammonia-lyase [Bacteroidota bacterium]
MAETISSNTFPEQLTIVHFENSIPMTLSEQQRKRVVDNRAFLEKKLESGNTYYGINTGFGSLCDVRVSPDDLALLQENLVCSHACGFGDEVPEEIVRIMIVLKIQGLLQGFSGIRIETIDRLIYFYQEGITPIVYEQGSLGASGDLAPLAHLSLPLIGKGEVYYRGKRWHTAALLEEKGIAPLRLGAKEGLALLNGTQFMSAYAVWSLKEARRLHDWIGYISALSAEAFDVKAEPFRDAVHRLRPHKGQRAVAAQMWEYLSGSELQKIPKKQVQDPYSFRCIPQVHGASADAIDVATQVVETEINSVTDNPLVVADEDLIISGGNFHGQPLALQLDFLAIALSEYANISERRTYLLVSGQRGLPPFLAPNPGLNSGFMIAQYTAASIVSQNKGLCMPASVDSIVSSNGQEDHVSMGANAATKLRRVVKNVQRVLAIELLTAAQGLEFRRPLKASKPVEQAYAALREQVPFMDKDRVLHEDLIKAEQLLDTRL